MIDIKSVMGSTFGINESLFKIPDPFTFTMDIEEDSFSLPPMEFVITGTIPTVSPGQLLELLQQIDDSFIGFNHTPVGETVDNGDGTYTHTFRFGIEPIEGDMAD